MTFDDAKNLKRDDVLIWTKKNRDGTTYMVRGTFEHHAGDQIGIRVEGRPDSPPIRYADLGSLKRPALFTKGT